VTQDDAEDVCPAAAGLHAQRQRLALRDDHRGSSSEVHLGLRSRLALHPPDGQLVNPRQPPGVSLHGVVAAGEAVIPQILPDPLVGQTPLQRGNDAVAEGFTSADRAGIPGGRVWPTLPVRPGGRVWPSLNVRAGGRGSPCLPQLDMSFDGDPADPQRSRDPPVRPTLFPKCLYRLSFRHLEVIRHHSLPPTMGQESHYCESHAPQGGLV